MLRSWFDKFATACAYWLGHPAAFAVSAVACVLWAASGPAFGWSDTWQLIANTSTTIITYLAVFVIQHTQNRDTLALNVKLDEIVLAQTGARNELAGVEEKGEDDIRRMRRQP